MTDDDGREMKIVLAPPDMPSALLQKAAADLHDGTSPFSMVLVIGCYAMIHPETGVRYLQTAVAAKLRKDLPEELALLAAKLRQVLADIDAIVTTQRQPAS